MSGKLFPGGYPAPGFDNTSFLRRVIGRFTFVRLSDTYLHRVFPVLCPQRSPPRRLIPAAWGGLASASESRCRWALHHLSNSFHMLVRSLLLLSYVSAAHGQRQGRADPAMLQLPCLRQDRGGGPPPPGRVEGRD